jgi:hypothetical protein
MGVICRRHIRVDIGLVFGRMCFSAMTGRPSSRVIGPVHITHIPRSSTSKPKSPTHPTWILFYSWFPPISQTPERLLSRPARLLNSYTLCQVAQLVVTDGLGEHQVGLLLKARGHIGKSGGDDDVDPC